VSIRVEVRRGKGLLVIHQLCVLKKRVTSDSRSLLTCGKGGRRREVGFTIIKVYNSGNWKHGIQVREMYFSFF